jgi:hypothetical protein
LPLRDLTVAIRNGGPGPAVALALLAGACGFAVVSVLNLVAVIGARR